MTLTNQTPLEQILFEYQDIELLRSLWIESIEELVSIEIALHNDIDLVQSSGIKSWSKASEALQKIDPSKLNRLRTPLMGKALGCLFEDESVNAIREFKKDQQHKKVPVGLFHETLPSSIKLIDKLPNVRDQGSRGTCVAFASVALREFLIECSTSLSEQFLFWACKQLDGSPDDGTYISKAMSALAQYGVCKQSIWPYNQEQTNDVAQGPPPDDAMENARLYILPSVRTVEPIAVHIKNILYGGTNSIGMPVVVGSLVFNSWYKSAEAFRTGKITLPLPAEKPCGGHAWCIVGYVDDSTVPGGGFFIARNSWGTQWASESPVAPGHAMIPYLYIEKYALEAFTGPPLKRTMLESHGLDLLENCVRVLDHDARDVDGRLFKQGTRVLFNRMQNDIFKEDTAANRQVFMCQDYTWTPELRQRLWFPPLQSLEPDLKEKAEKFRLAKISFVEGVEDNLRASIQSPIPAIKPFSLPIALLAWEQRIRYVQEKANLTDILLKVIVSKSGIPSDVAVPDEWARWLREFIEFKVFEAGGKIAKFHVVIMVSSSFHFNAPSKIEFTPPGAEIIGIALQLYDEWAKKENEHVSYVFYSLGSLLPWIEGNHSRLATRYCIMLSCSIQNGSWSTELPSAIESPDSVKIFLEHLKPETRAMQCEKIKKYIDEMLDGGFEGYLDIRMIAMATGYSIQNVKNYMKIIAENNKEYRLYRTPTGSMAISKKESLLGKEIRLIAVENNILPRIALLTPALTVLIRSIIIYYLHGTIDIESLIISILVAYIGEWINTRIKWKKQERE